MEGVTLRTDLRPGDLGSIVHLHGVVYAGEHGFDPTFEAYVADPLAEFVLSPAPGGRLCGGGAGVAGRGVAPLVPRRAVRSAGFCKAEERPGRRWGVEVVEERYELRLR